MRALKVTFLLAGLLALTQYLLVYYNSWEFSDFVRHEAGHTRSESQLRQSLLEQARVYSLPVKDSDISISRTAAVFRVAVDYRVHVNLLLYNPELTFHVRGSGLLPGIQ
jgi:hypothetical protein